MAAVFEATLRVKAAEFGDGFMKDAVSLMNFLLHIGCSRRKKPRIGGAGFAT